MNPTEKVFRPRRAGTGSQVSASRVHPGSDGRAHAGQDTALPQAGSGVALALRTESTPHH